MKKLIAIAVVLIALGTIGYAWRANEVNKEILGRQWQQSQPANQR
jgi:hypothetical protein